MPSRRSALCLILEAAGFETQPFGASVRELEESDLDPSCTAQPPRERKTLHGISVV